MHVGPGSTASCKRRSLGVVTQKVFIRDWKLPGLHVSYDPLAQACADTHTEGQEWVQVELAGRRRDLQKAEQARKAREAKM